MASQVLYFLELSVSGLAVGSMYALIALGFVLIFKATKIMNFAHGEVIMVAAFICFHLVTVYRVPFWIALPVTMALTGLMGVVTERLVLRPMLGEPIFSVVMVTIGLSIFLRSIAGICFGDRKSVV